MLRVKDAVSQRQNDQVKPIEVTKWDNNTVKVVYPDLVEYQLHNTVVVAQHKNRCVILNTDGWYTNVTKDRINRALQELGYKAHVTQKNNEWFFTHQGKTVSFNEVENQRLFL